MILLGATKLSSGLRFHVNKSKRHGYFSFNIIFKIIHLSTYKIVRLRLLPGLIQSQFSPFAIRFEFFNNLKTAGFS